MSTPILDPVYNEGYPSPYLINAVAITFAPDNIFWPSVFNLESLNEGYPSNANWINVTQLKAQTRPFPKILPVIFAGYNEDYPVIVEIDVTEIKAQTRPFPRILPAVIQMYNENYPVIAEFDATTVKAQEPPYPKVLPDMEHPQKMEGYPSLMVITHDVIDDFGAFCRSEKLAKIVIPKTVKHIADYTFYDTNLKKVTIASDCVYYPHSFPEECEVEFYEEE